jgi:hypothetical protein
MLDTSEASWKAQQPMNETTTTTAVEAHPAVGDVERAGQPPVTLADLEAAARRSESTRLQTRRNSSLEPVRVPLSAPLTITCALPGMMVCSACGGSYVAVELRGHGSGCPACYVQRDVTRVAVSPASSQPPPRSELLSALSEAGVNMHKYRDATLASFDCSEDPDAAAAVSRYVNFWRDTHGQAFAYRPWMYLFGDGSGMEEVTRIGRNGPYKAQEPRIGKTGNGKTFIAIAAARQLMQDGLLHPDRFLFVEMEEILMRSEATIRGDDDSEDRLVKHYAAPDLLIIDDAWVRPPTNHSMRLVMRILNRRAGRGLIITSNISPKTAMDWEHGMRRLVDRLLDDCGDGGEFIVRFRGRSRRSDRVRARAA